MAKSLVSFFSSFIPGLRLVDGGELLQMANALLSVRNGLTALAGGGAPGATPLLAAFNRLDTVATAADSCLFPAASAEGQICYVRNNGAADCTIYCQGTDLVTAVNALSGAGAASISVATTKTSMFVCDKVGDWRQYFVS